MKSAMVRWSALPLAVAAAAILDGCSRTDSSLCQGYFEGDFVYVSSPLAGRLDRLAVSKGARVAKGALLFSLERESELAAERQAQADLASARSRLADASKGARPSEVASLNARLQQAKASAELSSIDLARQEQLLKNDAISQSDYDRARLTDQGNRDGVAQLNADLETARLASRPDIVAAAEAAVQAAQAAEEKAEWAVTQKEQHAPADALVFDTIYRAGEFVGAGLPVVELLPPENLKVRFFVSEAQASRMKVGAHVAVHVTGTDQPLDGTVSYLSPQAEYTPPVLYNRDNREKLVYMAEAVFAPALARDLHPGQPVDVNLPP